MRKHLLFISIGVFPIVFGSCDRHSNRVDQQETTIDIVKIMEEADRYEDSDYDSLANASYFVDYDNCITYFKRGSSKLAADIPSFMDSIGDLTGIPMIGVDIPEFDLGIIRRAISELGKYQKGERQYFPESEVGGAMQLMDYGVWHLSTHGTDAAFDGGLFYWLNFVTQAALICPSIDYISQVHSADNCVGLHTMGGFGYGPVLTCMVTKKDNHCFMRLVDLDVSLQKVFRVSDARGRQYYLLAPSGDRLQNETFGAYLYEKRSDDDINFVTKKVLSHFSLFDKFYDEIPVDRDEDGNEISRVEYSDFALRQAEKRALTPSAFMDSLRMIYNPKTYQWDLCIRNGGEYWHKIEGTASLYLHLDEKEPYFEMH